MFFSKKYYKKIKVKTVINRLNIRDLKKQKNTISKCIMQWQSGSWVLWGQCMHADGAPLGDR
jgi:hypothetical protein